jgi:hypothetical protein
MWICCWSQIRHRVLTVGEKRLRKLSVTTMRSCKPVCFNKKFFGLSFLLNGPALHVHQASGIFSLTAMSDADFPRTTHFSQWGLTRSFGSRLFLWGYLKAEVWGTSRQYPRFKTVNSASCSSRTQQLSTTYNARVRCGDEGQLKYVLFPRVDGCGSPLSCTCLLYQWTNWTLLYLIPCRNRQGFLSHSILPNCIQANFAQYFNPLLPEIRWSKSKVAPSPSKKAYVQRRYSAAHSYPPH